MDKIKSHYTENGVYKRIREYNCFACIKARCNNRNNPKYNYYGGRGVKCLYKNFQEFISDIGLSPSNLHTVDRIDNMKHYEKGNCKWATRAEQLRNRRNNIVITHNGITKVLKDWVKYTGLSYGGLMKRYKKGQDIFSPIKEQYRQNNKSWSKKKR